MKRRRHYTLEGNWREVLKRLPVPSARSKSAKP